MDISILIKEHYISLKSYTTWIIQNKLNWDLYPQAIPSHILFSAICADRVDNSWLSVLILNIDMEVEMIICTWQIYWAVCVCTFCLSH